MCRAKQRNKETQHKYLPRSFHFGLESFEGAPGVTAKEEDILEEKEKMVLVEGKITREPEPEDDLG